MNLCIKSIMLLFVNFIVVSLAYAVPDINILKHQEPDLFFVENKGQIIDQYGNTRNDIQFKLSTSDLCVFIGNGELHYQWYRNRDTVRSANNYKLGMVEFDEQMQNKQSETIVYRLDAILEGANKKAVCIVADPLAYMENYYLPQCKNGVSAKSYRTITYKDIYPNIDWVLYINDDKLKYDFVVHAGGDPAKIRFKYDGQTDLRLAAGNVNVVTPYGTLTEHKPYSYDAITKEELPSTFVLDEDKLAFNISNSQNGLVIDPTLSWLNYFDGDSDERIMNIHCNKNGDIGFAGFTQSTNNIATTGAHQTVLLGTSDGMIGKTDATGNLLWVTYYGGSGLDEMYDVMFDKSGNVVATGMTYSTSGISTTNSHQTTLIGDYNAMLIKFNNAGIRQWGTYYGHYMTYGYDIVCDSSNNIYLTGTTKDATGIATPGAHQTTYGGYLDAYLVKFDSTGSRQWATYYGDAGGEIPGVSIDKAENVYLSGYTSSTSQIATSNVFQTTFGGASDCFIAKFSSSGVLKWGTYYGGYLFDRVGGLVCDDLQNVYITGNTTSDYWMSTPGAHQLDMNVNIWQEYDAFLAKFDSTGNRVWSTYYGGDFTEAGWAIEYVAPDAIYFAGSSNSPGNALATSDGFQPNKISQMDREGYIARFDTSGKRIWGSYLGFGNSIAEITTIASTGNGTIVMGGYCYAGLASFLASIYDCIPPASPGKIIGDTSACLNSPLVYSVPLVSSAASYTWTFPAGWTGTSNTNSVSLIPNANGGTVSVTSNIPCASSVVSSSLLVHVNPLPAPSVYLNNKYGLSTDSFATYQWYVNGQVITGATTRNWTASTNGSYEVSVTDSNGCTGTSSMVNITGLTINDNNPKQIDITIYPNPVEEQLYISGIEGDCSYAVMDLLGRQLMSGSIRQFIPIEVKQLLHGNYIIKVLKENRLVSVLKFSKY